MKKQSMKILLAVMLMVLSQAASASTFFSTSWGDNTNYINIDISGYTNYYQKSEFLYFYSSGSLKIHLEARDKDGVNPKFEYTITINGKNYYLAPSDLKLSKTININGNVKIEIKAIQHYGVFWLWKKNYSYGPYNIIHDNKPPEMGDVIITPSKESKYDWYNGKYTNKQISIKTDKLSETATSSQSGLETSNGRHNRNSLNPYTPGTWLIGPTEERVVSYSFYARDNVWNSVSVHDTYYIDKSPPTLPKMSIAYTTSSSDEYREVENLRLKWNEAIDQPLNASGLKGYYFSCLAADDLLDSQKINTSYTGHQWYITGDVELDIIGERGNPALLYRLFLDPVNHPLHSLQADDAVYAGPSACNADWLGNHGANGYMLAGVHTWEPAGTGITLLPDPQHEEMELKSLLDSTYTQYYEVLLFHPTHLRVRVKLSDGQPRLLSLAWPQQIASIPGYEGHRIEIRKGDTSDEPVSLRHKIPLDDEAISYGPGTTEDLFIQETGKRYALGLLPVDNLFQSPQCGGTPLWESKIISTQPESLNIEEVKYGVPYVEKASGLAVYPVSLRFNQTRKVLDHLAEIKVLYRDREESEQKECELYRNTAPWSIIRDLLAGTGNWSEYTPDPADPDDSGQAGQLVLHTILRADQEMINKHAHRHYHFRPVFRQLFPDSAGNAIDTPGTGLDAGKEVPNLVDYMFLINTNGESHSLTGVNTHATTLNNAGIDFESFGVNIREGAQVSFALEEWEDAEGDSLSFELFTINDTLLIGESTTEKGYASGFRQKIHCYLQVHEKEKTTNREVADTETWDYRNAIGDKGQGFYLNFDAPVDPREIFLATAADSAYTYPEEYLFDYAGKTYRKTDPLFPVFRENIKLGIRGETAEGVSVMNIPYTEYLREFRDHENISREDLAGKLNFDSAATIACSPGQLLYDWPLHNENEEAPGGRMVAVRFGNGNSAYYTYRLTILDTEKPSPPVNMEVVLRENTIDNPEDDIALFNWNGEEGYNYQLSYTASGQTTTIRAITDTTLPLSLSGLKGNTPVPYELRSAGCTGQLSDPVHGIFRTPACPGSLSGEVRANYDVVSGEANPYLSWELSGSSAARFRVRLNGKEATGTEIQETDTGKKFKISNLDGRSEYAIELRACNSDGHQSANILTLEASFPNFPPEACQLLSPGAFVRGRSITFNWKKAVDGNRDSIDYTLEVSRNDEEFLKLAEVSLPDADGNLSYLYNEGAPELPEEFRNGYFTAGNTYHWRVVSSDGKEETCSAYGKFSVDPGDTLITSPDKPQGFTDQATMQVDIAPSLSGLEGGLTYTAYAEGNNNLLYNGSAALSSGNGGMYSASIPLEEHHRNYTIRVSVVNGIGETITADFSGILIDRTAPKLVVATPDLPEDEEFFYSREQEIPLLLNVSDNFSGFREISYGFSRDEGTQPVTWIKIPVNSAPATDMELPITTVWEGEEGTASLLTLQVIDNAGQASSYVTAVKPIYYDATPPCNGRFTCTGLATYNGRFYLENLDKLADLSLAGEDEHSGIQAYTYALTTPDDNEPVWRDSWDEVTATNTDITDGDEYYILGQMKDKAGNLSGIVPLSFIADSSPPENPGCDLDSNRTYLGGEILTLQAIGNDPHTPVSRYTLRLGTGEGDTSLSTLISPATSGVLEAEDGIFRCLLPEFPPGRYDLSLEIYNAAGNCSQLYMEKALSLADSAEKVIVQSEGPYHADSTSLSAAWQYKGDLELLGYQYRLTGPGYEEETWWPANGPSPETAYQFTGLHLAQGAEYKVEVKTYYADDLLPPLTAVSPGVIVDTTAPQFDEDAGFTAPAACHGENLAVAWDTEDPESGISSVELRLEKLTLSGETGNTEYTRQLVGTIPLATATRGNTLIRSDGAGNVLGFSDGSQLFLTMRITNGAGLSREKSLPALTWDNSPPQGIRVIDQGKAIKEDQVINHGLSFHWIRSGDDPESGIAEYAWQPVVVNSSSALEARDILADPSLVNETGWHNLGTGRQLEWTPTNYSELPLPVDGQRCFILVKAHNTAGLETTSCSDGIDIDKDGPLVSDVKLLVSPDTSQPDTLYINHNDGLYLHISAEEDVADIILYETIYGIYSDNGDFMARDSLTCTESTIPLGTPEFNEGDVIYFEGKCRNNLDLESTPLETGFTQGVLYETKKPQISYVMADFTQGELNFNWGCAHGITLAPVVKYLPQLWLMQDTENGYVKQCMIDLQAFGTESYPLDWLTINIHSHNNRPEATPEEIIPDGTYMLIVQAETAAGNISHAGSSKIVIVDTTPPELEVEVHTQDRQDHYTCDSMQLNLKATDQPEPAIMTEYAYTIGSLTNPFLYTTDWRSIKATETEVQLEINLRELDVQFEEIPDKTDLYIRARVKDRVENQWSREITSGPVTIDKTPPGVTAPVCGNIYNNSPEWVRHLQFSVNDPESGLAAYRTAVVPDKSAAALEIALSHPTRWNTVELSSPTYSRTAGEGYTYTTPVGYHVQNGDTAYMVVQAQNETGQWSTALYSPQLIFDTEAPSLDFSAGDNGVLRMEAEPAEYVFNQAPLSLRFTPTDNLSPEIRVRLELLNERNEQIASTDFPYGSCLPGESRLYEYSAPEEEDYTDYKLHLTLWDKAGNSRYVIRNLRVNDPPAIQFPEFFETTPGKPIKLGAEIQDPDNGQRGYIYHWEWNDPAEVRLLGDFNPGAANPELRLLHKTDDTARESSYALKLSITDADGATSTEPVIVKIHNTRSGSLYYSETWSDTHEMTGNILVPATTSAHPSGTELPIKLIVAPGTLVEVRTNNPGYRLTVEGSLELGAGSRFMLGGASSPPWDGIYVKGKAELKGTTITQAFRGLTILPGAEVVFLGSNHFLNNKTGLHILNPGQNLSNLVLTDNTYYGIKEEDAQALVADCLFAGNRIHYHTREETRLDIEQLNNRPGNSGNREE